MTLHRVTSAAMIALAILSLIGIKWALFIMVTWIIIVNLLILFSTDR